MELTTKISLNKVAYYMVPWDYSLWSLSFFSKSVCKSCESSLQKVWRL